MFLKHVRSFFSTSPRGILWDGAAAAVADPAAAAATTPAPAQQPAGQQPAGGAPAAAASTTTPSGADPAGPRQEDRSRWIPPHRLVEETRKREGIETQLAEARRQVAALTGAATPTPEAAEAERVKDAFFQMFPQYRKLTPEAIDRLLALEGTSGELSEASKHHWGSLANRTLRSVETSFLDVLGADKLTPRQSENVRAAFGAFATRKGAEFGPRYEAEDAALIEEFIKEYSEDMFEPVRRQATSGVVAARRPVPRGGPSAPLTTAPPVIDFKDPVAVENEAVRRMKEAGKLQDR